MKTAINCLMVLGVLLSLGACSSGPEVAKEAETLDYRGAYIEYAESRLEHWEGTTQTVDSPQQELMIATVRDGWTELERLKDAPESQWKAYSDRLDAILNELNQLFERYRTHKNSE